MTDIPELGYFIAFKTEYVHQRSSPILTILFDVRINRDQIAVFECKLDIQDLLRTSLGTFFHSYQQSLPIAPKIGVMVAEMRRYIFFVCLPYSPVAIRR